MRKCCGVEPNVLKNNYLLAIKVKCPVCGKETRQFDIRRYETKEDAVNAWNKGRLSEVIM